MIMTYLRISNNEDGWSIHQPKQADKTYKDDNISLNKEWNNDNDSFENFR